MARPYGQLALRTLPPMHYVLGRRDWWGYTAASMDVSAAFATSLDTPAHIAEAERLGFRRAWCYDSPPLYPDVWMTLALAAERTSVIGLGPAVLVPHLRHVMTNAAAIATLAALAPGRVAVAIGSGFTGRLALGQRPHSWRTVRGYVLALRSLLRGDEVEWDGTVLKMLHLEGFAPPRPIDVPLLVAIGGAKGLAVAEELADGVILTGALGQLASGRLNWIIQTSTGTVLDEGESPDSRRVLDAAGHAGALAYHGAYERGRASQLPRGDEYAALIDAIEPERPSPDRARRPPGGDERNRQALRDGRVPGPRRHRRERRCVAGAPRRDGVARRDRGDVSAGRAGHRAGVAGVRGDGRAEAALDHVGALVHRARGLLVDAEDALDVFGAELAGLLTPALHFLV